MMSVISVVSTISARSPEKKRERGVKGAKLAMYHLGGKKNATLPYDEYHCGRKNDRCILLRRFYHAHLVASKTKQMYRHRRVQPLRSDDVSYLR